MGLLSWFYNNHFYFRFYEWVCIPRHCNSVLPIFKNLSLLNMLFPPLSLSFPYELPIEESEAFDMQFLIVLIFHFGTFFCIFYKLAPGSRHLTRLVFDPFCKWRNFNHHSVHSKIFTETQIVLYLASGLFKLASEFF